MYPSSTLTSGFKFFYTAMLFVFVLFLSFFLYLFPRNTLDISARLHPSALMYRPPTYVAAPSCFPLAHCLANLKPTSPPPADVLLITRCWGETYATQLQHKCNNPSGSKQPCAVCNVAVWTGRAPPGSAVSFDFSECSVYLCEVNIIFPPFSPADFGL